jgi:hypothetical protein
LFTFEVYIYFKLFYFNLIFLLALPHTQEIDFFTVDNPTRGNFDKKSTSKKYKNSPLKLRTTEKEGKKERNEAERKENFCHPDGNCNNIVVNFHDIYNVMYSKKPFHMSLNDGLAFFSPSLARWKIIGDCEEDELRGGMVNDDAVFVYRVT